MLKHLIKGILVFGFLLLLCWDTRADARGQWDVLSEAFYRALEEHENTVFQLQEELESAKMANDTISVLLVELQMSNDTLRIFNEQIGERMQERDEELVELYDLLSSRTRTIVIMVIIITIVIICVVVKRCVFY